jgi:D-glycerate 3-kinase
MIRAGWHDELGDWIRSLPRPPSGPLVVGINGPQGGGKSTLAAALVAAAAARGEPWVALSVDDVYVPREQQAALAARFPGDPLMAVRGAPGTHDVALGVAAFDALSGTSGVVRLPSYDKSAVGGLGDRRPEGEWAEQALPVAVVLFEGWMLGFPQVATVPPSLGRANAALPAYVAWTARLHAMIQLRMVDPGSVVRWRVEAERAMRARLGRGLSDEEARAYVERFLPFYEIYPEALAQRPPVPSRHRVVWLGDDRAPAEGPAGGAGAR